MKCQSLLSGKNKKKCFKMLLLNFLLCGQRKDCSVRLYITYHAMGKFSRQQTSDVFLIPRKQDLTLMLIVSNPIAKKK